MKTTGMKDRGVLERVGDQMTQAQALRLKTLADEAYQLGSTRPISPSKRRRVALMRSTLRSRLPTRSRRFAQEVQVGSPCGERPRLMRCERLTLSNDHRSADLRRTQIVAAARELPASGFALEVEWPIQSRIRDQGWGQGRCGRVEEAFSHASSEDL